MKNFIVNVTDPDGNAITVDPNRVILNPAATNMKVATYSIKPTNGKKPKPKFINFNLLRFVDPKEKLILDEIFKLEKSQRDGVKKTKDKNFRECRKNKNSEIASLAVSM